MEADRAVVSGSPKREQWLDSLKGFAILLVIFGHVLSGYWDAWTFPEAYDSIFWTRSWIYSFHMPLFFMVSGYTFTLAYYRDGVLQKKRYFRQLFSLFWLYTVFALLQWGIKQLVPDLVNQAYDTSDLLRMYLEPLGNFWYLYVLFVFYLVAAVLHLPRLSEVFVLVLGGISVIVLYRDLDDSNLTLYRILYHFFYFAAGIALCRNKQWLRSKKLYGVTTMFLASCTLFYTVAEVRYWHANWWVLIAFFSCFAFLWDFRNWRWLRRSPLFQLPGRYCLELYLLHTFFTGGLRTVLPLLGITTPWLSIWANFLLSTGFSLGIAILAAHFRPLGFLFRPLQVLKKK